VKRHQSSRGSIQRAAGGGDIIDQQHMFAGQPGYRSLPSRCESPGNVGATLLQGKSNLRSGSAFALQGSRQIGQLEYSSTVSRQQIGLVEAALPVAGSMQWNGNDDINVCAPILQIAGQHLAKWPSHLAPSLVFERVDSLAQGAFVKAQRA
jgi:hypothetical protein